VLVRCLSWVAVFSAAQEVERAQLLRTITRAMGIVAWLLSLR